MYFMAEPPLPVDPRELEREFETRVVPNAGGLLILHAEDAIALVHRAEAASIPILGVDGFVVRAGATSSNEPSGGSKSAAESPLAMKSSLSASELCSIWPCSSYVSAGLQTQPSRLVRANSIE